MDISQIKDRGSENLKQNFFPLCISLLLVGLIPLLFSIVEYFITAPILEKIEELALVLSGTLNKTAFNHYFYHYVMANCAYYLWTAIFSFSSLVFLFFDLSLFAGFLTTAKGEKYSFSNIKDLFKRIKSSFCLNLLLSVKVALWSLLFVVPGIIKFLSYSMANYIRLKNPELSAKECLKKSSEMMNGKKGKLFALNISFFGWIMLYFLFSMTVETLLFIVPIESIIINAILIVILYVTVNVAYIPLEVYMSVANAVFYLDLTGQIKEPEKENFEDFLFRDFNSENEKHKNFYGNDFTREKENEPFSDFDKKTEDDTPFGDF